MDDPGLIRRLLSDAQHDNAAVESRSGVCAALTAAFIDAGKLLWVGGALIGADGATGHSPFEFGSDATVGLATVAQIAGELCAGTSLLLEADNSYGACALLRQVVEIEYLAWAFADDEPVAAQWLRSSRDQRQRTWQPKHIRDRSAGRFRAADYGRHCEIGGHPTPAARVLLPDHSDRIPASWWWLELATHGVSCWDHLLAAAGNTRYGYGEQVRAISDDHGLDSAVEAWRERDRLAYIARGAISASRAHDTYGT